MQFIKNKTQILLLTHFVLRTDKGPVAPLLLNYLLDKVKKIVYIEHPFPHAKHRYSYLSIYEYGTLIKQVRIPRFNIPSLLDYVINTLLTNFFLIQNFTRFDLSVACENLSLISMLPFKWLHSTGHIIYLTVDYHKKRFANPLINWVYHLFDRVSCRQSDSNWVNINQQIKARKENNLLIEKCSPFYIVPLGYDTRDIKIPSFKNINPYNLVYAGALMENSGPQLPIQTMPKLVKRFPNIRLTIIGTGLYEDYLKTLTKQLKLGKYVQFTGFIKSNLDLYKILTTAGVGLAPFVPNPDSLSYFSDPSKIKLYLVCGLPVITTKVTTMAEEIIQNKAGLVIDYNEEDLYKAVSYLLDNKKRYRSFKNRAIFLSKRYDINRILSKAFKKI